MKPRGRMSCFMIFVNERRPLLSKKYPDSRITDLTSMVAKQWKSLSSKEQQPYRMKPNLIVARWRSENEIYKRKLKAYKKEVAQYKLLAGDRGRRKRRRKE